MTVSTRPVLMRIVVAALSLLVVLAGAVLLSAPARAHGTAVEATHETRHADDIHQAGAEPCRPGDVACDTDQKSRKAPCSATNTAHCAQTGLAEAWPGIVLLPERRMPMTRAQDIALSSLIYAIEPPPPRV